MSQVISLRDLQDMVRAGQDVKNLPADALITPSARDFLREWETQGGAKTAGAKNPAAAEGSFAPVGGSYGSPVRPTMPPSTSSDSDASARFSSAASASIS